MVVEYDLLCGFVKLRWAINKELCTDQSVFLHLSMLIRCKAAGALEKGIANTDLSNIVKFGGNTQSVALAFEAWSLKSAPTCPLIKNDQCIRGDAFNVRQRLARVTCSGHADHAQDDGFSESGAFNDYGCHRSKVRHHVLIISGEWPRGFR